MLGPAAAAIVACEIRITGRWTTQWSSAQGACDVADRPRNFYTVFLTPKISQTLVSYSYRNSYVFTLSFYCIFVYHVSLLIILDLYFAFGAAVRA